LCPFRTLVVFSDLGKLEIEFVSAVFIEIWFTFYADTESLARMIGEVLKTEVANKFIPVDKINDLFNITAFMFNFLLRTDRDLKT
jgi:hypothetical protein